MGPIDTYLEKVWQYLDCGEDIGIESRLFRLMTLSVSLLCIFFAIPTNLMQDLSPYINVVVFFYGLFSYCMYRCARRNREYIKLFYVLTVFVLNVLWFMNGGAEGCISYFFFPVVLLPLTFFRGSTRLILLAFLVLNNIILNLLEHYHPSWIIPYRSESDRLLDLSCGFFLAAITCALGYWIVITAQEREWKAREHAEALLAEANHQLDLRVQKRTSELEIALKEQEAFSYSVSHDLRAPLRHINAYLTILSQEYGDLLPAEAHGYLARSRDASNRMGRLIDDLLELSRISRMTIVKRDMFDVTWMVSDICSSTRDREPGRQVEVIVSEGLTASGDKTLLRQMLENLIGNAWKYTSTREFARIEFGKEVVSGREVFYVRDNGVGFDMAYADKLFGPFQRLHGPEFVGNGIGLATVKRILERHGGDVWAESAPNEGATFFFSLGEAIDAATAPKSPAAGE